MTPAQSAEKAIRDALAAGPSSGEWEANPFGDVHAIGADWLLASCGGKSGPYRDYRENSQWIAAANPAALTALLDELEMLRRDAGRMDYIENRARCRTGDHLNPRCVRLTFDYFWPGDLKSEKPTVREAIDAAMKENRE